MEQQILWKPNPGPQTIALTASPTDFFEVGYGGRRGGGKTAGGIGWLLYDKDHPLLRALIIRKLSEDLRDWVDRAKRIYEPLGAVIKGNPPEIHWPSGAIFRTGHLKDANAYGKYVGHEYQRILIEELNLIPTLENYLKLISSCRSTIPDLRPQVMSNFNPSDEGFYWIREYFGIEGIPEKPIIQERKVLADNREYTMRRIFIPAGLKDNPYLDRDPQYHVFLDSLPDGLREAWRDGSWDDPVIKGAYYTQEIAQARREGRIKHVAHDPRLLVHTVWDLGMDDAMSIGFFQRTGSDIRIIDYYQNDSYGIDHYIAKLRELEKEKKYRYGYHFAPHDANKRELGTGNTLVQTAEALHLKFEVINLVPVSDGIQKVRLMFPRFLINETNCTQFLNGIRNYRHEWDPELLKYRDTALHNWASHPADMLRYTALIEEKMTNEEEIAAATHQIAETRRERSESAADIGL
jgi:hypothetical protein